MKRDTASTTKPAPRYGQARRAPNRSTDNDVAVLVKMINSAAGTSASKVRLETELMRKDRRSQAKWLEYNKTTAARAPTVPSAADVIERLYEDFNKA